MTPIEMETELAVRLYDMMVEKPAIGIKAMSRALGGLIYEVGGGVRSEEEKWVKSFMEHMLMVLEDCRSEGADRN